MRKKSIKSLAVAAAVMIAAVLMTGCGSQGNSGAAAASTESASTAVSSEATEAETELSTEAAETEEATMDAEATAEAEEAKAEAKTAAENADIQAVSGNIIVSGYEWGPGVDKIVFELPEEAEAADIANAVINTNNSAREVTEAYLSDEEGNKTESASKYVTAVLATSYENSGSPFVYDFQVTMMNDWAPEYQVAGVITATVGGEEKTVGIDQDLINSRISPDAALFTYRDSFSGKYKNPMTGEEEDITLNRAAYEPDALVDDGAKNPLLIWLHGQGEGGTDVEIDLLGNEVTALAKDDIQKQFSTEGGAEGAYVLTVQTPTYWMDGGDGTNSAGDLISRYTEALMDTIDDYVKNHPDVDTNRIYLSGCSNGGYMTVNMAIQYPEYWAAIVPNCEAYAFNVYERDDEGNYVTESTGNAMGGNVVNIPTDELWMTDDKIEKLAKIPSWFLASADDSIVNPLQYELPTYQAMLKAGAENAWFSYFENIQGTDSPESTYMGHWVWTKYFNNEVTNVQDRDAIKDSEDENFGFAASNDGGGAAQASDANGNYNTVFEWLNAQTK
ncbi:prolyl oligopeptidase family serine peptidase [Lachnospiraceae bacterium C1.1]|nr:prolyl oligopeptidase family serine peptidase [Lachnospiraceae bacterium C1.1]